MDREEIVVVERPESVSWEQISVVLKRAHEENVKNGIILPYPHLPPEEIRKKIEDQDGVLYVALDGEKVVATGAVKIIHKSLWCGSGNYAYCFFAAVLPEYSGRGIYRKLIIAREKYARSMGVSRMLFDTDERNKRVLSISKKDGYQFVDYKIRDDHNSVLLVKWLDGCPYSRIRCFAVYLKNKIGKKIKR